MDERLVTIRTYSQAWEAHLERMALEDEGISTFLSDVETVSMNWFYSDAIGGVKLQVPESKVTHAQEILSRIDEEGSELAEKSGDKQTCPHCGSTKIRREQQNRRWFYLSILLLGLPLYWPSLTYRCRDCGETWPKTKD